MTSTAASAPKLSICITTYNRAEFIGTTLASILNQITCDCEVIVLDGASTDNTSDIVSHWVCRSDRLSYVRQEKNNGFDQDCDRVVEMARGEYCWLMTDDDLLKDGAIASVLRVIGRGVSLVIVNAENRDFRMEKVLQCRRIDVDSDQSYGPGELDALFVDVGDYLQYVGCVVIKRSVWLARERKRHYGSWFIHVGVILQESLPGNAIVLAAPLISFRMGNAHNWSPRVTEILLKRWPALLEASVLSASARRKIMSAEPWSHPRYLLLLRALGFYSCHDYHHWIRPRLVSTLRRAVAWIIAVIPGRLVNAILVLSYARCGNRGHNLQMLRESRFYSFSR